MRGVNDHRGRAGHRDRNRARPRDRRHDGARHDPNRHRRQLRGAVGAADRPARRRERAARVDPASVHRHRTDRRRDEESADAARSGSPDLLQRRSRRPGDGRLRAQSDSVGAARHSGRIRVPVAAAKTGTTSNRSWRRRSRACRRCRPRASSNSSTGRSRSRRTAISFSARRRNCAAFTSAPVSTRSVSRRPAARDARSPSGSRPASRRWTCGRSTSAGSVDHHRSDTLGAHAHVRGVREALHDGVAARGISQRRGRCACRRCTRCLKDQGACFGEKLGWERPNWFAPAGIEPNDAYTYGRQNWFMHVRAEHVACRERVALFDQTSFAKFVLAGKDAERALQWICSNDVAKAPGSLTYTQMLNARGGIECDLTVARVSRARVLHRHWHRFRDPRCRVDPPQHSRRLRCGADGRDVGVRRARIDGPARARRARTGDGPRSIERGVSVRRRGARSMSPAPPVRALRVTYVGELGWELHIPVEQMLAVYERLLDAGRSTGSSTRAIARSSRCASRKAIARGAATSVRTIRRSKPDSVGR